MFAISERHCMTDPSARAQSVSIIVPTLNEEENIAPLVSQITACAVPFREILFVDDRSTDATRAEIRALERRRRRRAGRRNYDRCEGRERRNSSRDGRRSESSIRANQ